MNDIQEHRLGGTTLNGNNQIPDFIRKLHSLLEDERHSRVVSWGDYGKSFIVKDQSEFSKSILPMHFKHSNFASFVRQLNKYDFHKVKRNNEEDIVLYGEHAWEFDHPMFQRNRHDLLGGIKRKCTSKSTASNSGSQSTGGYDNALNTNNIDTRQSNTSHNQIADIMSQMKQLKHRLDTVTQQQEETNANLKRATLHCEALSNELQEAYHGIATRDKLMNQIVQYLVDSRPDQSTFSMQLKQLIETHADAITAFENTLDKLNIPPNSSRITPVSDTVSPRMEASGGSNGFLMNASPVASNYAGRSFMQQLQTSPTTATHTSSHATSAPMFQTYTQNMQPLPSTSSVPPVSTASPTGMIATGMNNAVNIPSIQGQLINTTTTTMETTGKDKAPTIARKRKQLAKKAGTLSELETRRPSWLQPPKVLLVEDDIVCRRLSGKILQVFGCTFDEAEDGLTAVNKMNISKYDLVLMDIMMPHLDGMSATAQIRQFDRYTPIVSLTANFTQDARIVYMSCGMNDVLPKPFSKDTLLSVVEKYCVHLMRTQCVNQAQMTLSISRPLPPAGTIIEELDDNATSSEETSVTPTNTNAIGTIGLLSPSLSNHAALSPTCSNNSSNDGNHGSVMTTNTSTVYNNPLSAMMFDMAQHMANWNESSGMTSNVNSNNSSNTNTMNTGVKRTFIEVATEPNPNTLIANGLPSNSTLIYNFNQEVKRART
ncbi:hypothetical protein BDF22DRAFT_656966 [Syncephalis plumigaleata]|nr:hypothetical protein BDF22DRAFT_656966 [Syncephalis plumigaleata]